MAEYEISRCLTIQQPWINKILARERGISTDSPDFYHLNLTGLDPEFDFLAFEVRSWMTNYRGPVVLHASTNVDQASCNRFVVKPNSSEIGKILGWAELAGCIQITDARGWAPGWCAKRWETLRPYHLEEGSPEESLTDTYLWVLADPEFIKPAILHRGNVGLQRISLGPIAKAAPESYAKITARQKMLADQKESSKEQQERHKKYFNPLQPSLF